MLPNAPDPLGSPLLHPGTPPAEPPVALLATEALAAPTRSALDALLHAAGPLQPPH